MPDMGWTEHQAGTEAGELGSFLEEMIENLTGLAHYFPQMTVRALSLRAQAQEIFRLGQEDYDHEDEEFRHAREAGLDWMPSQYIIPEEMEKDYLPPVPDLA